MHKEAIFDFQMMFSSDAGISSTMYISTVLIYSGNPAAESEVSTETETDRANAALRTGFKRLKPAKNKFTRCDFTNFSRQISEDPLDIRF